MTQRKEQIQIIRAALRQSVALSTNIRNEIRTLAWVDGSPPRLVSERNAQGQKVTGKRALKPFRRPETGPERYHLWDQKRDVGTDSRYLLLALGLVRGIPYTRIERKADTLPSAYRLFSLLSKLLPENPPTQEACARWLAGEAAQQAA